MNNWCIYIIDKKGKFYVGITTDLPNRLKQHGSPKLLYKEGPLEKAAAARRERLIHEGRES